MAQFQAAHGVTPGREWEPTAGLEVDADSFHRFIENVPFRQRPRRDPLAVVRVGEVRAPDAEVVSTQDAFGRILNDLARRDDDLARALVTTSPDVTVSTGLGGWVNQRGVFRREAFADLFRAEHVASLLKWEQSPAGQHIELGIAENNLFLLLAALGLAHELFGARLLPVGTLYDPFVCRGLDALNYACYPGCSV